MLRGVAIAVTFDVGRIRRITQRDLRTYHVWLIWMRVPVDDGCQPTSNVALPPTGPWTSSGQNGCDPGDRFLRSSLRSLRSCPDSSGRLIPGSHFKAAFRCPTECPQWHETQGLPVVRPRKVFVRGLAMFASALTILTAVGTLSGSSAADAATVTSGFYLDLGASVSVGIQPTAQHPSGSRTRHGFSNDLIVYEASRGISLSLTELGCPGESVATMVNGQDGCYHAGDSQLADAITFLNAHHDQTGLVTIDLGFNSVVPCLRTAVVDPNCVQQSLAEVGPQLTSILTVLKAAAGPDVTFVGMSFADPYVAEVANGISSQVHALASLRAISQLDQTLATIYQSQGIPMANVARVFHLHLTSPKTGASGARVLTNAATVCRLTWMCAAAPYGPNIHPSAAGYEAIADAIIAVLPPPFR